MSDTIRHNKVVSALPGVLEANSVYYVRVGAGFDLYVTNDIGTVYAYGINGAPVDTSPTITYVGTQVSRIDYAGGSYKLFTYDEGRLSQLDYIQSNSTTRKTFTYNPDGTLAAITQTVL